MILLVGGPNKVPQRRECSSFAQAHLLGNLLIALIPGYTYFVLGRQGSYWDSRAFRTSAWEQKFYRLSVVL